MEFRSIGARLREYRKSVGMTVTEIAHKCGYSKQAWSNYENENRRPTLETLDSMAKVFGVSIDYLTGATSLKYDPRDSLFTELIGAYLELSDGQKTELISYIKNLKEEKRHVDRKNESRVKK